MGCLDYFYTGIKKLFHIIIWRDWREWRDWRVRREWREWRDWREWRESQPVTVLEPETDYEGADLPLAPSLRGLVRERVRQLRDPAIFEEDGRTYLLYSVAGEQGIAVAELQDL